MKRPDRIRSLDDPGADDPFPFEAWDEMAAWIDRHRVPLQGGGSNLQDVVSNSTLQRDRKGSA